jgi:hypothetical protein
MCMCIAFVRVDVPQIRGRVRCIPIHLITGFSHGIYVGSVFGWD